MKFTVDTEKKVITLTESVDMQELYSWMTAGIGIAGWKIDSSNEIYNIPSVQFDPNAVYGSPTTTIYNDADLSKDK